MNNNQSNKAPSQWMVLPFILIVLNDWFYILLVQNQPEITINPWFVLFPVVTPVYFVFAIAAAVGIYQKKKAGYMLANVVILLGALSASISSIYAYKTYPIIYLLFVPLVILNFVVVAYIAYYGIQHKLK